MTAGFGLVHRLAFGLEVVDAMRGSLADVVVTSEGPLAARLPRGRRPGRFRQLVTPGLAAPVIVRVADERRRYVPRRFVIPFDTVKTPRVALFPGAGFGPQGGTTGVRGRVVDSAGAIVPWVRVIARHPASNRIAGRADGDDRGEFLLLVIPGPGFVDMPAKFSFQIALTVWALPGPLAGPVAESVPPAGEVTDITTGPDAPPGFQDRGTTTVHMRLAEIVSPALPFTIH